MNPGNENPEIPSLKPLGGKEEEKKGTGMVPSSSKPAPSSGFKFPGFGGGTTGSKAFSAPNLKVRGIGGGGATVMDRLKNLRKKDLIFIAAGLCTLGMAPLAEHLLMSPEEQTAKLEPGFNTNTGSPFGGEGPTVYDPGNGVPSPGGLIGAGSDVITPLNVRDPSNLIMSPGAQKKADAVVTPPPPSAAPGKGESDWKDVLRDSAKGGASKAAAQAPRPRPNVGKMAGAIRGLSALGGGGGGTGASLKLDPLSASGVPNRAAGSNALTRSQATPGFRGATSRSGASSGAGEDLRAAGARQSDIFNKGGGAAAALDSASREAIPAGGAGSSGGRPGEGGETKNPGGNSQKDNKSLGESLAFIRQKMEMEKALDLKWERKKWNEFGRQKMMEESALKLGFDMFGKFAEKAFINPLADAVGQAVAGGGGSQVGWECTMTGGGVSKFSKGEVAARGWEVRPNGDLISKGGQGAGAGAPLGKCKEAVVGSSNAGGDGTTTDRRDGSGVKAPGADQMAGRERRMSDASGKLGNERDDALALTEQIKGTCEGLTDPKLAAVKANCLEFQRESGELAKGLGGLTTASEEMTKAWRFLGTASGNMEREQTNLNASVRSLGTAAQKLTAAEQALRVPAGTEELPKDLATKAQTEVEAARAALKAAKTSHEASKPGVDKTNQALIDSKARGGAADDALKTANTDITGVAVPKAVDAAGTTIQLAPFETKLAASKQRALDAWLEIRKDHTAWSKGQGFGEQSKEALHGTTAAAEEMKIDLEGGANAPVEKKGAMGTAYNNFGAFGAPLTAKTDPYQASYKAAEAAFTKAKATCAAANTAPCAQAATDYNAAVTEGLKAPQGNGSMPAQNQENQTAANKDLATAVGHVQSMVSSVQSQPAASQQPASQQPAPAAP